MLAYQFELHPCLFEAGGDAARERTMLVLNGLSDLYQVQGRFAEADADALRKRMLDVGNTHKAHSTAGLVNNLCGPVEKMSPLNVMAKSNVAGYNRARRGGQAAFA